MDDRLRLRRLVGPCSTLIQALSCCATLPFPIPTFLPHHRFRSVSPSSSSRSPSYSTTTILTLYCGQVFATLPTPLIFSYLAFVLLLSCYTTPISCPIALPIGFASSLPSCSTDLQCTLSNERPRSFRPTTRRRTVRDNELARTPANLNAIDDRLGLAEAHSALFDLECFGGVGAVVLSTKYEFCHYGKYRGRADGVLRGIMEYVPRVQVHETLASTEAA